MSLHVREWGSGQATPVVLWHALGPFQSGAYTAEVASGLASQYGCRVFAPDGPGFGHSAALAPEAYRPSALAELAAQNLTGEEIERVDWIGASWGGTVGCWFAARHPGRLRRLVLLDVGYQEPPERKPLEQWVEQCRSLDELSWSDWREFENTVRPPRPALAEAMRESVRRAQDGPLRPILTPEVAGAVLWGVSEEPPTPQQLQSLPVLLLTAGNADEQAVTSLRTRAPHVETRPVPDTGHDLVGEAGPDLVPVIGEWLTRP